MTIKALEWYARPLHDLLIRLCWNCFSMPNQRVRQYIDCIGYREARPEWRRSASRRGAAPRARPILDERPP